MRPDSSESAAVPDPSVRELVLAACVAAVAAACLFFGPLFGDRSIQSFPLDDPRLDLRPWVAVPDGPAPRINPITPDIDLFVLPGMVRVRQLLADEGSAWWDGGQLLGYPLAANQPYPLFSPLSWLTRSLDPVTSLDWLVWLHTALAALLAYRAARMLGCRAPAAWVAGVGFALSTWMVTRWHLPQITITSTWWPGVLAAAEWVRRGRLWRGTVEFAVFGGMALASGFPQVALALLAGAGAWLVLDRRCWTVGRVLATGAGLALAIGLTWAPFALSTEAYQHSLRSTERTREATAAQGLNPGALFGAVLPEFFGRPSDFAAPDPPAATMEAWLPRRRFLSPDLQDNVVENAMYPGVLLLLLLLVALGPRVDPRGRRLAWLALFVVAGCMLWPLVAGWWPRLAAALGAGHVKRALVLLAGCVPLAGAVALQALLDGRRRVPWIGAGAACVLLAFVPWWAARLDDPQAGDFAIRLLPQVARQVVLFALAAGALWWATRWATQRTTRPTSRQTSQPATAPAAGASWDVLLPALVLALDLGLAARAFNPFQVQADPAPAHPILERLAQRAGRVCVLGPGNVLPPTVTTSHGVRSVHGVAPMVPTRVLELLACVEDGLVDHRDPRIVSPFQRVESLSHPVLDLLNVTTIAHGDPALLERLGPPLLADEAAGIALHDRPTAGPRAFLCGGARVVSDKQERLALLTAGELSFGRTVLLEVPPGLELPSVAQEELTPVAVTGEAEGRYLLEFETDRPAILVFSEAWDPGWRVTVDGEPGTVLIADHALLGVAVEPGRHEVRWSYEPPGHAGARNVAWVAALLLALAAAAAWREARRPHDATRPPKRRGVS